MLGVGIGEAVVLVVDAVETVVAVEPATGATVASDSTPSAVNGAGGRAADRSGGAPSRKRTMTKTTSATAAAAATHFLPMSEPR